MPEHAGGLERWRHLGRLLPRDVRERVFEPALADSMRAWLVVRENPRTPFVLQAVGTFLGCLPPAVTRAFVRRGHLTRLGWASVWAAAMTAAILLVRLTASYPSAQP